MSESTETTLAVIKKSLETQGKKIEDLHRVVIRGDDNKPSHVVQIDRVTRDVRRLENDRKWNLRILWGAVISALSGLATLWFGH